MIGPIGKWAVFERAMFYLMQPGTIKKRRTANPGLWVCDNTIAMSHSYMIYGWLNWGRMLRVPTYGCYNLTPFPTVWRPSGFHQLFENDGDNHTWKRKRDEKVAKVERSVFEGKVKVKVTTKEKVKVKIKVKAKEKIKVKIKVRLKVKLIVKTKIT